jgi:tRNA-Thr(GGU) m(6)t(6)A37 methyltransferase TsaA
MQTLEVSPVAHVQTDFKEKFGIPRQSGRAPALTARIVFEKEYRTDDALRGIEGFSHLWLLFHFSATKQEGFSATVRPPRLGGNERVGVFASRSPFRPNKIGLSCVKLERIEHTQEYGTVLIVSGADLLDGTPILDIKPYLPFADCIPSATGGYAQTNKDYRLQVIFPSALLDKIPQDKREGLMQCLADDPRPSYQEDGARTYGMRFGEQNIRFQVEGELLTVTEIF